jgi:hypothetical protein
VFEGRKGMTELRKAAESAKQVLENKLLRADEHIIAIVVDDLRQALEQWDTSDMAHRSGGLSVEQSQHPLDIYERAYFAGKQDGIDETEAIKRIWVWLTDEEIAEGVKQSWVTEQAFQSAVWWAEAKLKERNT